MASPAYLEREGALRAPSNLRDRTCLRFALPEFRSRWLFRHAGVTEEIPVKGDIVISSVLALRAAALGGLGPALLADWLIGEDLAAGRLIDVFPAHEVTATSFDTAAWLLYPSRAYLPQKVRATVDFLRARLAGSE